MALILAFCFSGGILSKIISPEKRVINTFEEIINSGLKVYNNNDSWIWHQFNNNRNGIGTVQRINKLDNKMIEIEPQIDFINKDNLKDVIDTK